MHLKSHSFFRIAHFLSDYRRQGITRLLLAATAAVVLAATGAFATKLNVDADGSGSYTTIASALAAASSGDTVYIMGSDVDTYTESWPSGVSFGTLTIMGNATDPDSFPVLTLTGTDWTSWWTGNTGATRFERVTLSACATIDLSNTSRTCEIDKCVIKSFTSDVFALDGQKTDFLTVTNTLFWSNATIFTDVANMNVNGPYGTVFNCTFYGNTVVNNAAIGHTDGTNQKFVMMTGCLFNSNTTLVPDADIKGDYSYCFCPTSESPNNWGDGYVESDSPGFTGGTPSVPSDFNLQATSPARDIGTPAGAPSDDINGNTRSFNDAGAFEGMSGVVVTLDADGGADYTSLDTILYKISFESFDPDTILIVGDDIDSYTWNQTAYAQYTGLITIRSDKTDPDSFPTITFNESGNHNALFWSDGTNGLVLENIIYTASTYMQVHTENEFYFIMRRCIIRDVSTAAYVFELAGDQQNSTALFENCLFENNSCPYVFHLYFFNIPNVMFNLNNCTFDNNTKLFDDDDDGASDMSFSNCVFSNNTTTFSGDTLRSKVTYSLTSEAITNYGTGCVSNADPDYVQSSRAAPADWMLNSGSPAEDIGTSSGAPADDLGGNARTGTMDAGCWAIPPTNFTWDTDTSIGWQTGSGTWSTSDKNWASGSGGLLDIVAWPNGADNEAVFAVMDGSYTITVSGALVAGRLTFENSGYTVQGGTSLTASELVVYPNKTATIATALTGSTDISKAGTGTLVLSGTNTYTGTTNILFGVLRSGANGVIPDASNVTFANTASAIFDLNGNTETVGSLAGGGSTGGNITLGGGALTIGGDNTTTSYNGIISESGSLTKTGSGTFTLTGTNTYTGTTTISGGTLQIGTGGTTGAISNSSNVTNNSALIINRSDDYSYSGVISGTGTLTKQGAGTLTLTGSNTYTGTTTISSGTLSIGSGGTTGSIAGDIAVESYSYWNESFNRTK